MKQNRRSPDNPGEDANLHLLIEKIADIEARLAQMPEVPPSTGISDEKLGIIATSIYRARRRRQSYFSPTLFAEPAWDMLLDLFANRCLGRRINITSLCVAADVPVTTGLRQVEQLENEGLIERIRSPGDRRVTWIRLTQLGYTQMRRYVIDGITRFEMPKRD